MVTIDAMATHRMVILVSCSNRSEGRKRKPQITVTRPPIPTRGVGSRGSGPSCAGANFQGPRRSSARAA